MFSYVNEVWIGSQVVLRSNRGQFPGAFALEAQVLGVLGSDVPHAELLEWGEDELGEWMLLRRVPGRTWTQAFPELSVAKRRALVEELAAALVSIRSQLLPDGFENPWLSSALESDATVHEAHHPPVEALPSLLRRFRGLGSGHGLAADLENFAEARTGVFCADDLRVLVHGDIHRDNLLVDDGHLAAVLDWEGARPGRPEQELDSPLRFAAWPWLPVAEWEEKLCRPEDYMPIPAWLRVAAPELFDQADLRARLELHALAHDLVQALHFPDRGDGRKGTVWWRLGEMAAGRTHLEQFDVWT
jgi:hypothetical protein